MKKKSLKLILVIYFILVITTYYIIGVQASSQTDPLNDVISVATLTTGDYADYIDIHQVEIQGSAIIITTEQGLASLSSIKHAYFMALLSDDGDPTNFEATIVFSYLTAGAKKITYWMLTDPLNDQDIGWTSDYSGTHSRYEENILQLFFLEFDKLILSEVLLVTFVDEGGSQYCDWTSNSYDYVTIQSIIDSILFTLPPVVVSPDTTIPTTSPTTHYPETTESSTIISMESSEETTTTETSFPISALFPTSGFSILSIMALMSLVVLIQNRRKK